MKDFSLTKVDKGARYVAKSGDELTKNRREDDEGFEGEMMFQKIPRTSSCSKGQRKEVKLALTVFVLIIERLSMTFTADGKRQRLPLIFYSFLVILK